MSNNDIDALGQQAQLLAEYVDAMPLLERTGDEISGSVVRARDMIDEVLRLKPITKPTTYAESLQAREDLRTAKELGALRDRFAEEIELFTAETDALNAGKPVSPRNGSLESDNSEGDNMPVGFNDPLNRDPGDGQ